MNGSLFFSKVNENYAGSYTCTPYNDLGTDGPSPIISVIVLRPPIFSVTPKAIYIQKLGETAELPCEAIDRDGNNRPSIVWSRVSPSQIVVQPYSNPLTPSPRPLAPNLIPWPKWADGPEVYLVAKRLIAFSNIHVCVCACVHVCVCSGIFATILILDLILI